MKIYVRIASYLCVVYLFIYSFIHSFVVYLTTLSVFQPVWYQMLACLVNNQLERMWKRRLWT